jgi:hypothetical protein
MLAVRSSGFFVKMASTATMAAEILDDLTGDENMLLRDMGYQYLTMFSCNERLWSNMLVASALPRTKVGAVVFFGDDRELAVPFCEDMPSAGPYVRDDDALVLLRAMAWDAGTDLALVKQDENLDLVPTAPVGDYIGEPSVAVLADRVRKFGDTPRTVMIEGPSRVGKTVFARRLVRELGFSSNTLLVTVKILSETPTEVLLDLVNVLQPTVVLVDDISYNTTPTLLHALETLRTRSSLTILTRMTDSAAPRARGDRYMEGLAPGRIDEVWVLPYPDSKNRDLILRFYYQKHSVPLPVAQGEIVKRTAGLTGGYLAEVAYRLSLFGEQELLERELDQVLWQAPPAKGDGGANEEGVCPVQVLGELKERDRDVP